MINHHELSLIAIIDHWAIVNPYSLWKTPIDQHENRLKQVDIGKHNL